jgi:hypothetical protein
MTVKAAAFSSAQRGKGASSEQVETTMVMGYSDFGNEVDAEAPWAGQVADSRIRP